MKKITLNYLIDTIMFILMMAILGLGLLMKFVLVSGEKRWIKYGMNVEETFWGMDRHEWGKIHLLLGLILIAVLILHLILHWRSITIFFQNFFVNRTLRISMISVLVFVGTILIIFPFLVRINVTEVEYGYGRLQIDYSNGISDTSIIISPNRIPQPEDTRPGIIEHQDNNNIVHDQHKSHHQELLDNIEVKGYMTLREVSIKHNVPADYIKEKLGIPIGTSNNERLSRLRRWHGFTMTDVKEAIYSVVK